MISVSNMSVSYPKSKSKTLKNISFDVQAGEIFGFLGPSGAGKSTLQKVLTGSLSKYSGTVKVFNKEIGEHGTAFYERIGVDFEFPNFYEKFTALENLQYFSSLYTKKSVDLLAALRSVGLENEAHKKVSSFSKGMKMRLSFIRSLLHNPDLLFLDEPMSGLDPANVRLLKELMLQQKAMGKTIILTTHNMHDALELCDRVAFIVDGEIKALNDPKILQQGNGNDATMVKFSYHTSEGAAEQTCLLSELYHNEFFCLALEQKTLLDIHSQEKTLEDVFMELTGRCLL